jgi:hypothetical protein
MAARRWRMMVTRCAWQGFAPRLIVGVHRGPHRGTQGTTKNRSIAAAELVTDRSACGTANPTPYCGVQRGTVGDSGSRCRHND